MSDTPPNSYRGDDVEQVVIIPPPVDSQRPPILSAECPGHGSQASDCRTPDDDSIQLAATNGHDDTVPVVMPDFADDNSEMGDESVEGDQGDESVLGSDNVCSEIRRATTVYGACACACVHCNCRPMLPPFPPHDTWSIAASPASSRSGSPFGYSSMVVEVGSMASSTMSILRSPTPPYISDLFTLMTGGFEDHVTVVLPDGFNRAPLWLTPTVRYAPVLDEDDFDDFGA
ncbi:uncharacterized protein LTR77_001195 [Saxophila tyrrhenica]|uniref:Uncharacterized protein n=1 Tax=Saxophila tyrrhenica TaxID=1690608 RepID=A0AAV9PJL2_9PEZI|nr:hypothetical protein LTR77_001195 [Saxophila tyrrhenica]